MIFSPQIKDEQIIWICSARKIPIQNDKKIVLRI